MKAGNERVKPWEFQLQLSLLAGLLGKAFQLCSCLCLASLHNEGKCNCPPAGGMATIESHCRLWVLWWELGASRNLEKQDSLIIPQHKDNPALSQKTPSLHQGAEFLHLLREEQSPVPWQAEMKGNTFIKYMYSPQHQINWNFFHSIFIILWDCQYYPHFLNDNTAVQRHHITYPWLPIC